MTKTIEHNERLLTVQEAARVLNTSTKTIHRRIKSGALSVMRDGRILRIRPTDLQMYIAARRS